MLRTSPIELVLPKSLGDLSTNQFYSFERLSQPRNDANGPTLEFSCSILDGQVSRNNGSRLEKASRDQQYEVLAAIEPIYAAGSDWLLPGKEIGVFFKKSIVHPGQSQVRGGWHFDTERDSKAPVRNIVAVDVAPTVSACGILRGSVARKINRHRNSYDCHELDAYIAQLIADGYLTQEPAKPMSMLAIDEYHAHKSPVNLSEYPVVRSLLRIITNG